MVNGVLEVVDREKPLHLSIVGGDPLVRYRELDVMLPKLRARGIHVQVVTSAFRPLPKEWATWDLFNVVVSIDGLQPEHDARRKPATYDRILKNIEGGQDNHPLDRHRPDDAPSRLSCASSSISGHRAPRSEKFGSACSRRSAAMSWRRSSLRLSAGK